MFLRKNFLLITLIPLVVLAGSSTFYRFYVMADYTVQYQADCNPETESCFTGCEDDTCTKTYPYSLMYKKAATLKASCGLDITNCEEAYKCLPEEADCEKVFCSPDVDECFLNDSEQSTKASTLEESSENDI
jgi:hypothetical protein